MLLDERVDDAADRVAPDLERLDAADVRPQHGRDEDRAHPRASGEIVPARPVVVIRNGASSPTPAVASGRPALRASTAASEQTGQFGSRRSWSSVNSVSSASNRTSRPASVVPMPEQDLERLVGLEQAEDARHDAQDAGHGAAGRELGRRRGRVQAAIARPLERDERGELPLEPEDARVDDRDAGRDRRVVEDVAGLEGVGAVEDDVVAGDDPLDVRGDEHLLVLDDLDVRVQGVDRDPRGLDLALADPLGRVDDLALQVGEVDDVEVDEADRPDARRGEVQGGRAAEARRRR